MNILIDIAENGGVSVGPLEWFILTAFGYFILGFGGILSTLLAIDLETLEMDSL